MGMYYDELQDKYFDNDWDICAECKTCGKLVNEEQSTVLCLKCEAPICTRCAEDCEADENGIVCLTCVKENSCG